MPARRCGMGSRGACALIGGVLFGCAHAPPATRAPAHAEVQLAELHAQLADRDRTIRELEGRLALVSAPPTVEPMAARETVRIPPRAPEPETPSPSLEPAQRSAKAAEPRPMLRLHEKPEPSGARLAAPPSPVGSGGERLPVVSLPGASAAGDAAADDLYLRAIDLVRRREFAAALRELDAFLLSFADDPRGLRALYWRGEVLYAQREWARALESYESALAGAPEGDKAPDTLLRIARCCLKLGASDRAREVLAQLEARFPDSAAARTLRRAPADEDG